MIFNRSAQSAGILFEGQHTLTMASSKEQVPLAELQVADSRFLGFCFRVTSPADAKSRQSAVKAHYPDAAHVPVVYKLARNTNTETGFEEDDEPPQSVGPGILELLLHEEHDDEDLAVVIVRYFQEKLLGVTCGRLPQCYQSIARLSLHRFRHKQGGMTPMIWDIPRPTQNVYGMAAGDCELILNVVPSLTDSSSPSSLLEQVRNELDFGGFRGAAGEALPRLQNLQADLSDGLVPVYRYPGNYNGQEWATFNWAPTSLQIKKAVEQALQQPFVTQTMNHCVTNYYRDGKDFIAHHSDKDLDLNRNGVIVSVSLGDERIMELRRRAEPKDVTRIPLPHGSMLVLGPKTNQLFSHSILAKEESTKPRISLTLRDVKTFLDATTGRLFGQGVEAKSLSDIRRRHMLENVGWFGGFCALSAFLVAGNSKRSKEGPPPSMMQSTILSGLFATSVLSLRYWNNRRSQKREEQFAREFFSKTSLSGTKY